MSFLDFNPYSQASKLTILPHKLFLVKISKSDELFERKIKQIVKLIFFPDRYVYVYAQVSFRIT
jgi:hypothetical protein